MAHVLVYLQRTPQGVHPASALALCLARDIASERGATVTAMSAGDAGPIDPAVVSAAGRHGADVMVFCGPHGVEELATRLNPVHVYTPWTSEGLAAVQGLASGPATQRWLRERKPAWGAGDAITGVVAGALPWVELDESLEPEYQGDVDKVPMPEWIARASPSIGPGGTQPIPVVLPRILYVAPPGLDRSVYEKLEDLRATAATPEDFARPDAEGTIVWLEPGAGPLPDALGRRDAACRVILLPGPDAAPDSSWSLADWVLPGAWPDVLAALRGSRWQRAMG